MSDFFPPHAVIRRVSVEPALMFGAGRALMMQLAHPAVAQGVQDHSDFKANPFKRLQGTLEAMVSVVYGTEELAVGVGRRIGWIHEHVVGPTYRANDVDNLMWVHATLVDTVLRSYEMFLAPMPRRHQVAYYDEMTRVAEVFGVPRSAQPATLDDFNAYVASTVATLTGTPVAGDLARFILAPRLPLDLHRPLRPALGLHRLLTVGLTPPRLRAELGLPWSDAHEARYERTSSRLRRVYRSVPYAVRTAPTRTSNRLQLARAARRVQSFERGPTAASAVADAGSLR